MADQTPLEQKRAEARAYQGVTYDNRIDKFTASIMIRGERHYLGAFRTAGEASVAYEQTRAEHKIERTPRGLSGMSMKKALIAFEETAERDDKKLLVAGQIFTAVDGQRFRLEGMRRKEKHREYVWSSPCKICGALFEHTTGMRLRNANGMTRTCEQHRGQLNKMPGRDWPDPVEWDQSPRDLVQAAPADVQGPEPIPEHWDEVRKVHARRLRVIDPEMPLDNIIVKFSAMMSKKKNEAAAPSARLEDIELLASDPPPDNSDLLG